MSNFQVHPFDLSYDQIGRHRKQYTCPKGGLKNAFMVPKSTLEDIFKNLSNKIVLHETAWKQVLKEYDQSTFELNQDGEKNLPAVTGHRDKDFNPAEASELILLSGKIEFSDFLKAIQRESKLREILSEHQLYFHSVQRLVYHQETKLVTKTALEAMILAKQQGGKPAKIPAVTYLIDNLVMFTFQGVRMFLIAFENKTVQMYDCSNGHWLHDFHFYDNVFDQFANASDLSPEDKIKLEEKKRREEKELERAGMGIFEIKAFQRKVLREKGEYRPEIPPFTKVERPIDLQALRIKNKFTSAAKNNQAPELAQIGSFMGNLISKTGSHHVAGTIGHDGTMCSDGSPAKNLESEEDETRKLSPIQKFQQNMQKRSEASRQDSQGRYRRCCRQQSLALARSSPTKVSEFSSSFAGGSRNKTNLSKTMAFKNGTGEMSLESVGSILNRGDQLNISKNEKSGFLSNKNVLINLQTDMRGIPENEELDLILTSKGERQGLASTMSSAVKKQESVLTKSQILKKNQSAVDDSNSPAPRKFRNAPKLVSANSTIMKKFTYEINASVGNRVDDIVRQDVGKDMKKLDRFERENKEKIMNNIDEAEEERLLQEQVFRQAREAELKQERDRKNRKERAVKASLQRKADAQEEKRQKLLRGEIEAKHQKRAQPFGEQAKENRQDMIKRLRNEKRKQLHEERELLRNQRKNKVPMKMYGVLGLDSIIPKEDNESDIVQDPKAGRNEHSYGLDQKLFMAQSVREKVHEDYKKMLQALDGKVAHGRKQIKLKQDLEVSIAKSSFSGTRKRGQSFGPGETKPGSAKWIIEHPEELEGYIQKMKDDKNQLQLHLEELGERQSVFGGWLNDFNNLCATKIKTDGKRAVEEKNEGQLKKDEYEKKKEFAELENKEKKKPNLVKIREKMMQKKKERMEQYEFNMQDIVEDKGQKKAKQSKPTYPMCMEYYEPFNIAIFALVSREIQIHQLKQTGVKRTFFHIQSMRVESMIVQMSIEQHKSSGFLILSLGTQNKQSPKRSEVVCYLLDPKLEFEVIKSYRWAWPEEQITSVYYKQGCGLILSSFSGYMEIFDAVNVNVSVWDNCKGHSHGKKSVSGGSISTVSYSEALDIIAYGGVSGKIFILDQTTKKQKGQIEAHKHEIIMLKFYDKQHQLISVSQSGEVGLWDAQKLTEIQKLKNSGRMTQKVISACSFYAPKGKVLMATTTVFNYQLEIDRDAKIHTEQQNAIARDYLRKFFRQLEYAGVIKQKEAIEEDKMQQTGSKAAESKHSVRIDSAKNSRFDTKESADRDGSNLGLKTKASTSRLKSQNSKMQNKKVPQHKSLSVSDYLQTAYDEKSIKGAIPLPKEQNGSVLASQDSKLIGALFDPLEFILYTIDSDLMIRCWSMSSGKCQKSYLIETRDAQIAQANQDDDGPGAKDSFGMKIQRKKAQICRSDPDRKFLIVAFEGGELQVNNLNTGALIYNNANVEPLKIDFEIAHMKFFFAQTKFWIAASCWEGRVAFISRPTVSQGRNFLKFKKCKCSHTRDVVTLDINKENQLVTGSVDNIICFWNSFNGVESKKIHLPEEIASVQKGLYIQHIRFPFPKKKDYLLIIINNGDCYILETQTEKFLEFNNNIGEEMDEFDGINSNIDAASDMMDSLEGSPRQKISEREIEIVSAKTPSQKNEKQTSQRDLTKQNSSTTKKKPNRKTSSINLLNNPWILGRIANDPSIDLCEQYLLSVSENGKGMLHTLTYTKSGESNIRRRESARNQPGINNNPIKFELVGQFEFHVQSSPDQPNGVFQIDICIDHGIFLTSQIKGVISVFSLDSCQLLGVLNKGTLLDIPQNMPSLNQRSLSPESREIENVMMSPTSMNSQVRKSIGWPERALRDSQVRNSNKFGSDIFSSIWKNQTQPAVSVKNAHVSKINLLSEDSIGLKQSAQARYQKGQGARNSLMGNTAPSSNQYQTLQQSSQHDQYLDTERAGGAAPDDETAIEMKNKQGYNTITTQGDSLTTKVATLNK